jgi:hypothetical protein
VTHKAQYSFEATTLDYLSPRWYDFKADGTDEAQSFESKEAADAFVAEKVAAREAQFKAQGWVEPCVYRVQAVPTQAQRDEWAERDAAANAQYWADRARAAEAAEANEPKKGRTVEVVRGRKVPIGTKGYVIWYGEGHYGSRVGIKDEAGEVHWTAASNVAVLQEVPA